MVNKQAGKKVVTSTFKFSSVFLYILIINLIPLNNSAQSATILFADNFNDNDYVGWTIVDDGLVSAPSVWTTSNGQLVQNSNIYDGTLTSTDPVKAGTYIYAGDTNWSNYTFSARLKSQDDDGFGVMFRYKDANNYYRFMMDSQRAYRRITRKLGGITTILAEDSAAYTIGQWYNLSVTVSSSYLSVSLDGVPILSANDNNILKGKIALYCWGNTGSYFDDITVTTIDPVSITNITLPSGNVNHAYTKQLIANGGVPPYTWSIVSGSPPSGLSLSSTGIISGTPTSQGTSNFTVRARDVTLAAASTNLSLTIGPAVYAVVDFWATGDCEKIQPTTAKVDPNFFWNSTTNKVELKGARNEYISFQPVIKTDSTLTNVNLSISDLSGPTTFSKNNFTFFRETFQFVTTTEGNPGDLAINQWYPDPLIPFVDPYDTTKPPVGAPFTLGINTSQPIWVDCYIPKGTPAGFYNGTLTLSADSITNMTMNIELQVWNFTISDTTHLEAFGVLGGGDFSKGENVAYSFNSTTWNILKEYHKMARQHRLEFLNSSEIDLPPLSIDALGNVTSANWSIFDQYEGQRLDGTLFTQGSGAGIKPKFWWVTNSYAWTTETSAYYANVVKSFNRELVNHFNTKNWHPHLVLNAYDESGEYEKIKWYAGNVQSVVGDTISYVDTRHYTIVSTLIGYVDVWSPSADWYIPATISTRQALGEYGWFYHYHEPFVGHHIVNSYGISMRTWATIAWKYRVNGTYFWNVDYWPYATSALTTAPYSVYNVPTYEARWGNGVLLYPGRRLLEIGLPAIKGPVSSFRLKVFRRGVEDYEYCQLAKDLGLNPDPIVNAVITDGLGATTTPGSIGNWSHDPNDWYQMRRNLAALILGTSAVEDGTWQKY